MSALVRSALTHVLELCETVINADASGECRQDDAMPALSSERDVCVLTSSYTPQYVRSRVLKTPGDALMVLVSG